MGGKLLAAFFTLPSGASLEFDLEELRMMERDVDYFLSFGLSTLGVS